ncbi:hypothetical protein [Alloalcanivorax marinus]|uniref:hypothetical protein n=1 Tax=Alloalcanivorax marinus TaxID=1177169 RepID=UPI0021D07163|nr:hypothetical protein [Alloalcanivorax marinus]MCU5785935.1 hypothetical protein [Alloalcanivorax marinus]
MAAIDYLRDHGLSAYIRDDRVMVAPASRLTDDLRTWIREHKRDLLAELAANDCPARQWWLVRMPDGRFCRLLTPAGSTREQALDAATSRWPGAVVLDPEGATNGN